MLLEIDPNDCCGNGCANCILDSRPNNNRKQRNQNRENVLNVFRQYELTQKQFLHSHIVQLNFKLKESNCDNFLILDVPPGHHVMMRAPLPCAAFSGNSQSENVQIKKFTRPYTPFETDEDNLTMSILVNLSPQGLMTKYIEQLKETDLVEFRGPIGSFFHEPNSYAVLAIFTNGVAIASVLRIIDSILNNGDDMTRIRCFSCFTNLNTVFFRDQLYKYNEYWNFYSNIYLSKENCGKCIRIADRNSCEHFKSKLKYKENISPLRLSEDIILKEFSKFNEFSCKIIICGSKSFEKFVMQSVRSINVRTENISIL